jgi:hypothetical protein
MTGRRIALLIGQQSYTEGFAPIPAPFHDVDTNEADLRELCGFHHVIRFRDAIRTDFDALRRNLIQELLGETAAVVFVHYSGHAVTSATGQTLLVPIDATPGMVNTYYSLRDLLRPLQDVVSVHPWHDPGVAVVMLDACRTQIDDGAVLVDLTNAGGSQPRGPEMFIMHACDDSTLAAESEQVGRLTESFLASLEDHPGANLYELFDLIVRQCLESSNFRQRPWIYSCCQHGNTTVLNKQTLFGRARSFRSMYQWSTRMCCRRYMRTSSSTSRAQQRLADFRSRVLAKAQASASSDA